MGYENRLPPEGINVGKTNVLAEVFFMLLGFALSVVALVVFIYISGSFLATYTPFSWEASLARYFVSDAAAVDERSVHLQKLADTMAQNVSLPEGMIFQVQYIDDAEVNAYATVGGVIRLHRGLLERLHSENAIAMVLAHEMAHVINRDPAQAAGGRLMVALTLNLLMGVVGLDGLDSLAGSSSSLALLTFSREDERQADILGVQLVGSHYGHVGGVTEVFKELAAYESQHGLSVPEFMSSHPETEGRNATLREEAQKLGIPLDGALTNAPASLRSSRK